MAAIPHRIHHCRDMCAGWTATLSGFPDRSIVNESNQFTGLHATVDPVIFGTMDRLVKQLRRLALLVPAVIGLPGCSGERQMHGVMIDPPRAIAAFEFRTATGATYSTAPEAGRPMLVFFGYTHCPDVCPLTLADWKRAKTELGDDGQKVRYVFVTVDPERDTRVVAQRYAAQFDAAFMGLSDNGDTLVQMMSAFGVTAARESSTDSTRYFVSHSGQTFLLNDRGELIAMYPLGMGWDALVKDLKPLL